MSDPAQHSARRGNGGLPPRSLRILTGVFTVAAVSSFLLVEVDLAVGRTAAGDVFTAFLNSLAAVVF